MRVQIRLPSDFLHSAASLRAAASPHLLIDSRLKPAGYPAQTVKRTPQKLGIPRFSTGIQTGI